MVQPATILVGGGSGFLGRHLVPLLRSTGAKVQVITRNPSKHSDSISWDSIRLSGLPKQTTAVINLAGRNILDPTFWTQGFKQEVYSSRISTNKLLAQAINDAQQKPSSFVTVSGVGYYKPDDKFEYNEEWTQPENRAGNDYLMNLARDWEDSSIIDTQLAPTTRRVVIRSGVIIGSDGGVIYNSRFFFSSGLGGPLGSGKQWFPWIHVDDLAEMFKFAITNDHVSGIVNGVAPEQVRNFEFSQAFAKAFNKPSLLPVPAFALRCVFGSERADILLKGQKVTSRAGLLGFRYNYPRIQAACDQCVKQN